MNFEEFYLEYTGNLTDTFDQQHAIEFHMKKTWQASEKETIKRVLGILENTELCYVDLIEEIKKEFGVSE